MAANTHPYQRGFRFESALQGGLDRTTATCITAGPVEFWVEARTLTTEFLESVADRIKELGADMSAGFDDFGATVHVCSSEGEWLRFDCFVNEPHYHYNLLLEGAQMLCRIDEIAEGDPRDWILSRLRVRLPEMLEYAGATQLADWSRTHAAEINEAIDEIETLMPATASMAAQIREATEATKASAI